MKRTLILALSIMILVGICNINTAYTDETLYYYGDADMSGEVTVNDALSILKHTVNLQILSDQAQDISDVNSDGNVDVSDALETLKIVVGINEAVIYYPSPTPDTTPAPSTKPPFPFTEEELEWSLGAKYYTNTLKELPKSYMIEKEIRIDRQGYNQCSGYATAVVFRYLGEEINGEEVYEEIPEKNYDGTVMPEDLARYINSREQYRAQLYMGTVDNLKDALNKGVPVIILSYTSPGATSYHFIAVTGYDEKYIYMADSYVMGKTTEHYNRRVTYNQLDAMWNTEYEYYSYLFIVVEPEQ